MTTAERIYPKVGDRGYLAQITHNSWVDGVKRPVEVIEVTKTTITVRHAKEIWPVYHCTGNPMLDRPDLEGQRVRFYDTLAEDIIPDPEGKTEVLTWHGRKKLFGTKGNDSDYPEYFFNSGKFEYAPYLN